MDSGKAQESKPGTSNRKGKGGKEIPKEKNEPGSKIEGKEAGTQSEEGWKGWLSSSREQEGPPNPFRQPRVQRQSDASAGPAGDLGAQAHE